MKVHPAIAALRSDRSPQRHAQNAIERARLDWRKVPGAADMLSEIAAFGKGAPLKQGGQLEAIFTAQGEGERQMLALSDIMCACLAANPLGEPPFRNGFNGHTSSMQLARSGRAQLLIQSREPGAYEHMAHGFSDMLRYDAVLGGKGHARLVRLLDDRGPAAKFSHEALDLQTGTRLALDLSNESVEIDHVTQRLITLRLVRFAETPQPTREFDRASGSLLQQCAGNLATSRQEAIVALLGRMGRKDAAPQLAAIATGEQDASLRWQALRECLAMDTATGFAALREVARNGDDPLMRDASALRAQLIETYPQLAEWEKTACPA